MPRFAARIASSDHRINACLVFGVLAALAAPALAQQPPPAAQQPLQPGEAFVTRFSGSIPAPGGRHHVIDASGTVGSILDLRTPSRPPLGQHWIDEPQRNPVTAAEVGQVFGVALDDASPPNIYLTATAAFGLHTTVNGQWMPGMWGPVGPGAIYKLDRNAGYRRVPFANVTLNGRPNTGPALGNIAFDRWNKQFFVSDLETGMIHRIRASDGADLGAWDHGLQGRAQLPRCRGQAAQDPGPDRLQSFDARADHRMPDRAISPPRRSAGTSPSRAAACGASA